MKANGFKEKCMEKEFLNGKMEGGMKDNI